MASGTADTINLIVHIAAGAAGLIVGLVPLASIKGSTLHRRWGRRFRFCSGVAVATAILAVVFSSPPAALAAVTLSASYQWMGSQRALMLRATGPSSIDSLLALGAIALALLFLLEGGAATRSFSPTIAYPTVGYVVLIALYDLSRNFWREAWRRTWFIDHGLKMTGVYFAMASAGAGNLLRGFQPWSQLLPSMAGMLVMAVLLVRHLRPAVSASEAAPVS
jgi:hypothetical protein